MKNELDFHWLPNPDSWKPTLQCCYKQSCAYKHSKLLYIDVPATENEWSSRLTSQERGMVCLLILNDALSKSQWIYSVKATKQWGASAWRCGCVIVATLNWFIWAQKDMWASAKVVSSYQCQQKSDLAPKALWYMGHWACHTMSNDEMLWSVTCICQLEQSNVPHVINIHCRKTGDQSFDMCMSKDVSIC
jgi:hypothetical protein